MRRLLTLLVVGLGIGIAAGAHSNTLLYRLNALAVTPQGDVGLHRWGRQMPRRQTKTIVGLRLIGIDNQAQGAK